MVLFILQALLYPKDKVSFETWEETLKLTFSVN